MSDNEDRSSQSRRTSDPKRDDVAKIMAEAQQMFDELPQQMREIKRSLDSLSGSMRGLPPQMESLGTLLAEIGSVPEAEDRATNVRPDWALEADVRIGRLLHAVISADFNLGSVAQGGAGALPADMVQPRGSATQKSALIRSIEVRKSRIPGAPKDAERTLQLKPDANVPVSIRAGQLAFDLAPSLVVGNRWPGAELPVVSATDNEIVVPLEKFRERNPFAIQFSLKHQPQRTTVGLRFVPIS
ncbi:MAG: hypothetical protein JXD18_12345 [Anaerolineae bacterium]|nr:hypothetical protein [Anaerolineae bacterium]